MSTYLYASNGWNVSSSVTMSSSVLKVSVLLCNVYSQYPLALDGMVTYWPHASDQRPLRRFRVNKGFIDRGWWGGSDGHG